MAEEGITAVNIPPSPYRKNNSPFSSSFRFLGFPDSTNSPPISGNLYELDERDVVWSPEIYSDPSSAVDSPIGNSSPSDRRSLSPFLTEKLGLAVALRDVDRRSAVNVNVRRAATGKIGEVFRQSAPVNVPVWPRGRRSASGAAMVADDVGEEEEEVVEEEMLPPHLIVARSHVTTFSVFEGVGRTLKGRDLCRVRNAVFQKTGFID